MKFELTILGSNSAVPAFRRFPTAQVLNVLEQLYLIDCGEGTQMRMLDYGIRRSKIHQIFISHLHGDHIFGLIGLLTSMSLARRTDSLTVFSPPGLQEIIEVQLRQTGSEIGYPLHFQELQTETPELIFSDKQVDVSTIPLQHRIPAVGYLFREKKYLPNILPEQIERYQIPFQQIGGIKAGADFTTKDGQVIPNNELVRPARKSRSFAFCSDTVYNEDIIPIIKQVDLLYHETTFLHEMLAYAQKTKHTTAHQAATIAAKAEVGKLITGHYSSRYQNLDPILKEAQKVFPNTVLGLEGRIYKVT